MPRVQSWRIKSYSLLGPDEGKAILQRSPKISGFREHNWQRAKKIKAGDIFLCYMVGVSRWVGLFEIKSERFRDETQIFAEESFPRSISSQATHHPAAGTRRFNVCDERQSVVLSEYDG